MEVRLGSDASHFHSTPIRRSDLRPQLAEGEGGEGGAWETTCPATMEEGEPGLWCTVSVLRRHRKEKSGNQVVQSWARFPWHQQGLVGREADGMPARKTGCN